jgi:outer membrane protein assembly factor BamA
VTYQQSRIDAEHYIRIIGAANLTVRGAAGTTVGNRRAPQYFLSSFHTLRGVPFGDTDFLLGRNFFYGTVEFQFPIATFMELPLIDLEGVLAADFGGVGNDARAIWERRVLDLVFGVNLGFAPLVLRLHFGQPIGIGAPVPNGGKLVFNFSIMWRYQ